MQLATKFFYRNGAGASLDRVWSPAGGRPVVGQSLQSTRPASVFMSRIKVCPGCKWWYLAIPYCIVAFSLRLWAVIRRPFQRLFNGHKSVRFVKIASGDALQYCVVQTLVDLMVRRCTFSTTRSLENQEAADAIVFHMPNFHWDGWVLSERTPICNTWCAIVWGINSGSLTDFFMPVLITQVQNTNDAKSSPELGVHELWNGDKCTRKVNFQRNVYKLLKWPQYWLTLLVKTDPCWFWISEELGLECGKCWNICIWTTLQLIPRSL